MGPEQERLFIGLLIEVRNAIFETVALIAPWVLLWGSAIFLDDLKKSKRN